MISHTSGAPRPLDLPVQGPAYLGLAPVLRSCTSMPRPSGRP